MIGDTLISQIQIALIGIVVVIALFFVWRAMSRIEEKLDRLMETCSKNACVPGSNTCGWSSKVVDDDLPLPDDADTAAAEEFMRSVFGGSNPSPSPVVFAMAESDSKPKDVVVIEEEEVHVPATADDHESEADTDNMNPLSKSKLKKMNVDTLKGLCHERGLSTEGSKNVLIDRLLGLLRE